MVEPDHILLGLLKKDLRLIGAKWEERNMDIESL